MPQKKRPKKFRSTKKRTAKNKGKTQSSSYTQAEQAVLNTLGYRSVFNYPLSIYQLNTLLVTPKEIKNFLVNNAIKDLRKKGDVKQRVGKYYLKGKRAVNWDVRAKNSNKLLEELKPTIDALQVIPWIKLLAVTGSVAAYNARKQDDIDIFIVTKKNRLWLTRLFVTMILKVLGKYRTEDAPEKKICPNIYVPEDNMYWPVKKQNVYVAHEILMMHPIINRDDIYFEFMRKNDWVFKYFSNFKITLKRIKKTNEKESSLLDLTELLAQKLQIKYMKNKKTSEEVNSSIIHFNKYDSTQKVLQNYQKNVDNLAL